jgi:hypothetical protein
MNWDKFGEQWLECWFQAMLVILIGLGVFVFGYTVPVVVGGAPHNLNLFTYEAFQYWIIGMKRVLVVVVPVLVLVTACAVYKTRRS